MKTSASVLLFAAAVSVVSLRGQEGAPAAKNVLFMSADLNITYQGGLYHVNQVDRGYFVIQVDGKTVKVEPNERAGIGIKVKRQLRLAPFSARIDHWAADRAYATGSDPAMMAAVEFGEQRDIEDATEQNNWDRYMLASGTFDFAGKVAAPAGPAPPAALAAGAAAKFNAGTMGVKLGNVMSEGRSPNFQSNTQAWKNATGDYGPTPYDAIRITFQVSSPKPLLQPFVVFVGVFHERNKPNAHHIWIGGRDLDAVDEHPQTFHLLQDGFPKGFELEKMVLHLYDTGGREVATNMSEQRMEMTREDTFSYLLMDYFSHHKGDTLPATAAMTAVPADWRERMRSVEYTRNYFVKVDKLGHAQGLYQDTECTQPVDDAYLKGVVLNIRFRPALQKGKPVPGVARILPANLVQ